MLVQAQVVVATLHGSGSYELKNSVGTNNNEGVVFDTIIIDEVSQSLEPQCWIPLLLSNRFKRLVIAGDNMQLPPTIKHKRATHRRRRRRRPLLQYWQPLYLID